MRHIVILKNLFINNVEYYLVLLSGTIFGLSSIVRYLRNPNPQITVRVLRAFGATIGEKTTFKRSVFIDNSFEDQHSAGDFSYFKVGSNCYIGDCVYIDLSNEIILEDNVVVAGQVSFITHADCNRSKYLESQFSRRCEPIRVSEGAWIGFRAMILSGVEVGKRTIVAADSLLRENASAHSVYSGIPARKYKEI